MFVQINMMYCYCYSSVSLVVESIQQKLNRTQHDLEERLRVTNTQIDELLTL